MDKKNFQPFTDRLSRDIRNSLSHSLLESINSYSLTPSINAAKKFQSSNLESFYEEYISLRLERYSSAIEKIKNGSPVPLYHGLVLWDEGLFFEVHEVLEAAWMKAVDDDRLFLQAMIRAAGVYIKREAGYEDIARKIAKKAIPVLLQFSEKLSPYTEPIILITALQNNTQTPPKLLR